MKTMDSPETVKVEVALIVEGYADSQKEALAIAHMFQTQLNDLLNKGFPGLLELSLCQATCGDVEEPDG